MDYNISNYGYIETQNNDTAIQGTKKWNVPLNDEELIRQKYYNAFMVQNRSPFCSIKCKIEGDRGNRFVMIPPGTNVVIDGHNFRGLVIRNQDSVTQIQVNQVSVTVMKDFDTFADMMFAQKRAREGGFI